MYIHSLFNDIGLSVRTLLDKYILQKNDYIKRYEFNTGTRTFQIQKDYKVNYELPTCMISINDETPAFGQRPEVLIQQKLYNINQIPVLYNKTNDRSLFLQEEATYVPISVSINCESQFQAKELSHVIKRFLPLNKWINILEFTSFLEVTNIFLNKNDFDPNSHDVINLFMKPNRVLGDVEYCFSVKYSPMIRLESITASSPDSTQRSFACQFDLTYLMQWPMFLYSTKEDGIIEMLTLSITVGKDTPIVDFPAQKIYNPYIFSDEIIEHRTTEYTQQDIREASGETFDKNILNAQALEIIKDAKEHNKDLSRFVGIVRRNILISTEDQYIVRKTSDSAFLIIQFDKKDYEFKKYLSYNIISMNNNIFKYGYEPETVNYDDNIICFKFTLSTWDLIKPTSILPLLVQIYDPTIIRVLGNSWWLNISVS